MARRADEGVGFWRGAAQWAPSLSARRSGGKLTLPLTPAPKKYRICTNPVAMPVDVRGRVPPPIPPWLRYCMSVLLTEHCVTQPSTEQF